jgi:hypothetical protein
MAMTNYFGTTTNLVRFRDVEVALASTPVIPITERIVSASDGPIGDTIDFTPIPFGPDVFANFGSTEAVPVVGNFDPPVVPIDGGVESTIQLTGITATNEENALDVDGNGIVAPLDALAVVNFINRFGSEGYAAQTQIEVGSIQIDGGMRLDVNRDGLISPLDALAVINRLNQRGAEAEGEAESELFARWTESLLQPSTSAEVDFDLLLPPQQDALRPLDEAFANWDDDDEDEAALSMSMTWER